MKFAFSLSFRAEELHESRYMPCDTVRAAGDHAQVQLMEERSEEGGEMQEVNPRDPSVDRI